MPATTIAEGIALLARHGGLVEVRMPKTVKGTVSGYFTDHEALVRAVRPWDGRFTIFVTLNPVHPDLLTRAVNRLELFAQTTTADVNILRRVWFPVDFDPKRPAGISSTEAELDAALTRRNEVGGFLREMGFPDSVGGMSGNGGHLLYGVDEPNDEATTKLFERCLKALGTRFSDNVVIVDETVFNAARIWKLYGTVAVKGDATPARPHRRAELERVPAPLALVSRDLLEALAAMAPEPKKTTTSGALGVPTDGWTRIDVPALFQGRGLYLRELHDGKHAVSCPWASDHSGDSGLTETLIFDHGDGEPWGFDCKHAHCADRTIKHVLALMAPTNGNGHPPLTAGFTMSAPTPEPAYTFTPALPDDHFVTLFIRYAAECVDAAYEYFETIALILLATATPGVRARLRQYPRGLPTAFYAILIGDSTRSRKSSSAGLGLDLISEVFPDCRLAEQASPEAFVEQLATRGPDSTLWNVDEIGETLDKLHHARYMAGLRGLLLELYEGRPYRYKRTTKRNKAGTPIPDEMIVERPHLSVLGATTPSVFEIVTARDVASGFLARFAVVMPTGKPPRRGLEEPTEDLLAARSRLTTWLRVIYTWATSTTRPVRFAGDALAIVDRFAEEIETSDALANERSRAMLQRLNAMTVKLAMLSAAGRPGAVDADELLVTPDDATVAVAVARRWRDYAVAFGERVGETAFEQVLTRALKVVSAKGKCPRREVAQRVHCSKKVMDEIEATLIDRGAIKVSTIAAKSGPDARVWAVAR